MSKRKAINFKSDKFYMIKYISKKRPIILSEVNRQEIFDTMFICGGQVNKYGEPIVYEGNIKVSCIEESAIEELIELQWNYLKGTLE